MAGDSLALARALVGLGWDNAAVFQNSIIARVEAQHAIDVAVYGFGSGNELLVEASVGDSRFHVSIQADDASGAYSLFQVITKAASNGDDPLIALGAVMQKIKQVEVPAYDRC
jgi:hypothetical protein